MKNFSVIIIIFLAITVPSLADGDQQKRFDGDKVFRLSPATTSHLQFLDQLQIKGSPDDYDFWTEPASLKYYGERVSDDRITPHPVDVRVSSTLVTHFIGELDAIRLPYRILIDDVQKVIDDVNAENAKKEQEMGRRIWRTKGAKFVRNVVRRFADYDEIVAWLFEQCRLFPSIATCHDLGTTFENRTIRYIRLSLQNGPVPVKKRAVFVEAGMHAREWLSPATSIFLIDQFLRSNNKASSVRKLLESLDWYFLPVANPDGYQFSRTRHRMWRKTRSVDFDDKTCYGVDANRNFDFHWSRYGSSYSRCSELFHGSSALSEPETKAMADFIMAHRHDLLAFFSLHAYSQFWLLPYGHRDDDRPNDLDELIRVALIGMKALKRVSIKYNNNDEIQSEWQCGNSLTLLQYAVSGSSMDWAKGVANITYSYALELRPRDDPMKQDHNGFIAREEDIEKSGVEVLAGITSAVNAMLEKVAENNVESNPPKQPTQKTNEAEPAITFTKKLAYTFSSLTTWLISLFRNQNN